MKVVLLLVALFFAIVAFAAVPSQAAERLDFILEYRGHCFNRRPDGRGECELKAQSEEFLTSIKGDGKVRLEVVRLVGSISMMRISDQLYSNQTYSAQGNVTFGVHLTHENHKLHFQSLGAGRETTVKDPREMIGIATILNVVAGEGALRVPLVP